MSMNSMKSFFLSLFQWGLVVIPVLADLGPLESLSLNPNPQEVSCVGYAATQLPFFVSAPCLFNPP